MYLHDLRMEASYILLKDQTFAMWPYVVLATKTKKKETSKFRFNVFYSTFHKMSGKDEIKLGEIDLAMFNKLSYDPVEINFDNFEIYGRNQTSK